VTRSQLFAYALPAMALAMLTGPVFALLPDFFTAEVGLPLAATGLALLLSRVWDALCDPLVGLYADRLPSRLGMRKALMAAGAPLMLLGAWLLFMKGTQLTPLTLGLSSMLLFTGWTFAKLAHDAWGAELQHDSAARLRITGAREGLALVGGLMAILLIGWGKLPEGPGTGRALELLFLLVAGLILIGWTSALMLVPDRSERSSAPQGLRRQLALLNRLPRLKRLAATYLVNGLANALPATLFLPFVAHGLERPDLQGPLILLYFVSAILGVPLWYHLGKKLGKARAWRFSMLVAALVFAPAALLGPATAIWFAPVCVITGICLGGDLMLPPALQADVLDDDRARTGESRSGLLFALLGFLAKFAYALAPGIALPLLAWAGFAAAAGAVNASPALWMLALLYAGVPALLKLGAAFLLRPQEWNDEHRIADRESAGL
jgi:glycoside/pentoside/hexuronide:cation symporter, GPH family